MLVDQFSHIMQLLTIVTGLVSMMVTLHFLEPKRGWWNIALLFVVHLLTMNAMVFIGEILPAIFTMLGYIGAILLLCKGPLLARLSLGMILVLLPLSFSAFLTNFPLPLGWGYDAAKLLAWCAILFFVKKALPHGAKPPIRSTKLWALMDLLAIMPFGCVIAVLAGTEIEEIPIVPDAIGPNSRLIIPNLRVLLIVLAFAVVAAIALLVAVVVIARYEKLETEKTLWQSRDQHYRNLEQTGFQIRRLRHDMANHLTAMAGLDDAGMRAYLDKLLESPAMKNGRRYCENEVANAVLSSKVILMDEAQIPYKIEVDVRKDISIDDVDLCALFANGLDNAIEASNKMPAENRMVEAYGKVGNGLFMLEIKNNAMAAPERQNGQIVTSKKDRLLHGLGLASIREIAERYGGVCNGDFIDDTFRLHITIPIDLAI